MSKQDTTREEALEALESMLPGITKHFEDHEECCGQGGNLELVVGLFKETKKLQSEYPLLFALAIDAFEALRDHDRKLDMLKDILLSLGVMETVDMKPPDDGYLN